MTAIKAPVAFVEFHDARVDRLQLRLGGEAEIGFSHLAVYHRTDEESCDVWSYQARLLLRGVGRFELANELAVDDYIMDGGLTDLQGTEISGQQLLGGAPAKQVSLAFFSGARVTIACADGHLVLGELIKFLEKWSGPI